ncbi:MAG: AAA family ATPase, partial [Methylococcaceae bacterium]
ERGGRFEIRGSLLNCFRKGQDFFEISIEDKSIYCKNRYTNESEKFLRIYKVSLNPTINKEIVSDNIRDIAGLDYSENCESDSIAISYGADEHTDFSYSRDYESYYREWEDIVLEKLGKVYSYELYPRFMRGYSEIGLSQLSKNGSNLSSVLYYLHQNKPEILEEKILKNIKGLPEEDIEIFDFITTSDNSDVLVALKYTNGQVISAKLLSDGTLRALAILTALETVPEGSRIIIEEIDNGIHASRVNVLLNAIWEASNRRNLHTLITTHNPATLDNLSEEQLDGVVVCHYDKQSQSAKLTPFFEIPNVDVLMQKGKLGGLVTRNVIERYLDPDFEKIRKAKIKSWRRLSNV